MQQGVSFFPLVEAFGEKAMPPPQIFLHHFKCFVDGRQWRGKEGVLPPQPQLTKG